MSYQVVKTYIEIAVVQRASVAMGDLERDPLEFWNVVGDPDYASQLEDIRRRLDVS